MNTTHQGIVRTIKGASLSIQIADSVIFVRLKTVAAANVYRTGQAVTVYQDETGRYRI